MFWDVFITNSLSAVGDNDKIKSMKALRSWKSWVLIVLGILVNLLGRGIAQSLKLPMWLDALGTIFVAIELGPLAGAICGSILNVITAFEDPKVLPYMLVSIGIGVSVGVLYPRKSIEHFRVLSAGVVTGLVASILSTPINLLVYGGETGNIWGDALMVMLSRDIQVPIIISFLAQAFVDIPDKVLCVVIAAAIIKLTDAIKKSKAKNAALFLFIPVLAASLLLSDPTKSLAADFGAEYAGSIFDVENGLEAVEINAIAQTDDGYMWIGSYSGLYLYDGYKFKEADLDERIKNVMVLFKDNSGRLWIGTNDSGVACYDHRTGEISFYDMEHGLSSDAIRDITQDKEGNIYIATIRQLCVITPQGMIESYSNRSFYGISKLCASGDMVAGIRSDGYLIIFKKNKIQFVLAGDYTEVAAEDEGNFIVGTSSNITGRLYIKDGVTDLLSKHYTGRLTYFNDILYSKSFKGYFVACENGLGFVSDKGTVTDLSTDDFDSSICKVFVDYQGNVWFASSKQGIKKFSWNPFEDIFSRANLTEAVVNSVLVKDGLLYAGTNNGLVTIDLKTYYSVPIPYPEYLKNVRIRNLFCDSKGNVWVSTYGPNGLIKMRADGSITTFNTQNKGTEGDRFRQVIELSDGRILASTSTGLNYIEGETVVKTLGENDGISTQILSMVEDENGRIIAGSDGAGIFILENDQVVRTLGAYDGLRTLVVMKIVPCTGGYIYITSNALYYDDGSSIRRLDSFPYSNNYDIYITDEGEAWVLSSGGIFVLDEKDLLADGEYSYILLNRSRGLNTAITANSNYTLNGERLYISCTDGVRRVSTKNLESYNNEFEIAITELTVGDMVITPEDGVYHIPPMFGRIQFDVAVMNYSLSNPLVKIFLEGADDEGITCYQKNMQTLSFTNLPSGNYTLHVQIMDTAGIEVVREENFKVEKESLLFERQYFRVYLFSVCFLFIMYIGWAIGDLIRNITSVQKLQQEAKRDHLTGLLNKRGAAEALNSACSEKTGMLAILDLDSFKPVNDIFGHDMGDRLLMELADLMRKNAGANDILCRVGGDEFVVFIEGAGEKDIKEKTEILNREIVNLAKVILGEDMNIPLGVSVGAVKVDASMTEDYETLFKKADKALYVVKNSGKHDYVIYDENLFMTSDASGRANVSGIAEIRKILGERNRTKKPYRVENNRLQEIYRLLERLGDSSVINSVMIDFIVNSSGEKKVNTEIMDVLIQILDESLRSTDVYGYDNNNTIIVIITDSDQADADVIINRIESKWNEHPATEGYSVTYEKEML